MVAGGPALPTLNRSWSVLDANIGQRFPRQNPHESLPADPGPLAPPGEWPPYLFYISILLAQRNCHSGKKIGNLGQTGDLCLTRLLPLLF